MKQHGWDKYRPYERGDLSRVWGDLRDEDQRELQSLPDQDPKVIEEALLSANARVLTWDTEQGPVGILGVTPAGDVVGLIWAIATEAAKPRWRFAVKTTPSVLDDLGRGFAVLSNFKDTRNTQQIEWLKRVGFVFIAKHDGVDGNEYLEFVRIVQ